MTTALDLPDEIWTEIFSWQPDVHCKQVCRQFQRAFSVLERTFLTEIQETDALPSIRKICEEKIAHSIAELFLWIKLSLTQGYTISHLNREYKSLIPLDRFEDLENILCNCQKTSKKVPSTEQFSRYSI